MNENFNKRNEEIKIDLRRVFDAVLKRIRTVIIVTVLSGVFTFMGTKRFITPLYESKAMFYVNNKNISMGDTAFNMSTNDLSVSRNLVDTYIVVLNARSTLMDVIDYAGVDYTYDEIQKMIYAEAVDETEIFEVVVTSHDNIEADKIADAITHILPEKISGIIEGTSAKIVDGSIVAAKPASPDVVKNSVLGAFLGMFATVGIIALTEIFDTTIRTEEDIEAVSVYPVLVSVPDVVAGSKRSGHNSCHDTGGRKKKHQPEIDESGLIGSNVSFTASEAYKMLRIKVRFLSAGGNSCYTVGVSGALENEGKSVTASNLAYSMAQLNKKVLLIDCNMRDPSISCILKLKNTPGISNFLTEQSLYEEIIQTYYDKENGAEFSVITAGSQPPNPAELLSSPQMTKALDKFREEYEFIILDLPPIDKVSDAMAVSCQTDGMLIVSRMNYGNRNMLAYALKQFDFVGAKILGIVATYSAEGNKACSKDNRKAL